jgi:polysaccharide deacetylase family protein (PEP-CTERM system associated)
VEDWPQSTWDRSLPVTARGRDNAARLLDRLAAHRVRATMFVLGKFAEAFPDIVRRMAKDGHEVASHGHGHVEIFTQSREEFREDLRRSKHLLEDLTGSPVLGFRAPDFSITRRSLWALDVLAEEGFTYDSSIFPIRHGRYGIEHWPVHPVTVGLPSGSRIIELPNATITLFGRRLPVGGGGYHRLLPFPLIAGAIRRTFSLGLPFMAYCHPYEFDTREFSETKLDIPLKTRLHQGFGRGRFGARFDAMVRRFGSSLASDVAAGTVWPAYRLEGTAA